MIKHQSIYPTDPYCNHARIIDRLKNELEKYEFLIVGFDFDDTIYDYHNKGYTYDYVINLLKEAKELGFILCLYTVELDPDKLEWKINYCKNLGIEPDYVNKSPVMISTTKPFFNVLLDDRAGLYESYCTLKEIINYANSKFGQPGEK